MEHSDVGPAWQARLSGECEAVQSRGEGLTFSHAALAPHCSIRKRMREILDLCLVFLSCH